MSRARFRDDDPAGRLVPGAVERVLSAGVSLDGWRLMGSLRARHFGPRALVEDGSVRSDATTLVNMDARVRLAGQMRVVVDVFNLFDAKGSDIDYFYASRPGGSADPRPLPPARRAAVPRTIRVSLAVGF